MNTQSERRDSDKSEREMAWSKGLRSHYDQVSHEPLPDRFGELLEQLDDAELFGERE